MMYVVNYAETAEPTTKTVLETIGVYDSLSKAVAAIKELEHSYGGELTKTENHTGVTHLYFHSYEPEFGNSYTVYEVCELKLNGRL